MEQRNLEISRFREDVAALVRSMGSAGYWDITDRKPSVVHLAFTEKGKQAIKREHELRRAMVSNSLITDTG
ncbi:MAG: hypothetical protein ABJL33_18620 [Hyphomicrobiales bacterium]